MMLAKERHRNTKRKIEKHIYSSNRNKIQVNRVRQFLVNRKLRVQSGSDYCPLRKWYYVIVSRGFGSTLLNYPLTCIYGGGRVHYVGSITV